MFTSQSCAAGGEEERVVMEMSNSFSLVALDIIGPSGFG